MCRVCVFRVCVCVGYVCRVCVCRVCVRMLVCHLLPYFHITGCTYSRYGSSCARASPPAGREGACDEGEGD